MSLRPVTKVRPLVMRKLLFFAVLAQCRHLGSQHSQFGLGHRQVNFAFGVAQGFFGYLLGRVGFFFVEVFAANRGVGHHGHAVGLHFQNATGHENEFFAAVSLLDANRPGLDAGDQGKATKRASPDQMDSSALTTSTWMVFMFTP
jgi:hypothetical protein